MRIGLDIHVLSGQHQGTVTVWTSLLQHLPTGHTYILYSFDPEATRAAFPAPHFEHRRIPVRNPLLRFLIVYPWLARRDRCDVFHVNYYGPPVGLRRMVVTLHDLLYLDLPDLAPWHRRWMQRLIGGWTARRASRIIVVSDFTRRRARHHFRIPEERIAVVHNALPDEWLEPSESLIDAAWESIRYRVPKRYALAVGRWEPRKNHVLAAEVSRRLGELGLVDGIVIVGADDFGSESMLAALREGKLESIVTALRDLTTHALQALYRHATVLLFLSEGEGFGYPLIEAMAMGTPIVASNRGAISEVCADAATIVEDLSCDAVATAAARLLTDSAALEAHRRRGFVRARQFTGERYARRVVDVYEAVGSESPGAPASSR